MGNDVKKEMIEDFLSTRPQTIGTFGYGSGITKQTGYNKNDNPQIDIILVVENDKM
jgi:hypothetical protein